MIIMYTTHCPKCKVLEMKLKQKNIKYVEEDSVDEMKKVGLHSAPALNVDGQILEFADAIKFVNSL